MNSEDKPSVVLAKTVKGYGLGEAGEGRNITHQQKKLNEEELRRFRTRFRIPLSDEEVAKELGYRIVKVKHIDVVDMNPSDAALQMDLLNHPFFFFTDRQTGKPAVVYQREDGDVGLLISQD